MKIVPGERPRDRALVLSTGETLTIDELTQRFLPTGSFSHRPQVEAELSAIFDVLAALAAYVQRRKNDAV